MRALTGTHPPPAPAPADAAADLLAGAFELHAPALHRYLAARVGRDVAAELVADTFARAFRQRARFDPERGTVRGWLYGIAENGLRAHRRSEHRRLRALGRLEADWTPAHHADAPAGTAFLHAVARLDAADRELILLLAWGELTYEEIAQATGRTHAAVRSRLARLRAELRATLAEESP
jgi:RNA polymerase sigma-70 factor (ECF subfamily)